MQIQISLGEQALARFGNQIGALGEGGTKIAFARAVNHTGAKARTQVVRALTKQTGLRRAVIVRAVEERKAVQRGTLAQAACHRLTTRGGDIALKYFRPVEFRRGVRARPFGRATMFPGKFTRGGLFPNRKALRMGGHVFENVEAPTWGGRIEVVDSGVVIPEQMVTGETAAAWRRVIGAQLLPRLEHEVSRSLLT